MSPINEMVREATPNLYPLIWRWHFIAGLCVAPFLLILSVTGMIYLFNDELNDVIYPQLRFAAGEHPSLPTSRLAGNIALAYPDSRITRIDFPAHSARTVEMHVTTAQGENIRAFVDPGNGAVLGDYVYYETLVGFADRMHGSLLLGDAGDMVVELAACWTLVMLITGLFMWWPCRQNSAGTWAPQTGLQGRPKWKGWHKLIGLYSAVLIAFLIITGLPWASFWGDTVLRPVANELGLGQPPGTRRVSTSSGDYPQPITSHAHHATPQLPWTLQDTPIAESAIQNQSPIDLDTAIQRMREAGMPESMRMFLPTNAAGVYMAYTYPDQPEGQRTLQLDQYSGEILSDIRFADYGGIGKAVEWGVALHMGNYFGFANQLLMLIPCLGIIGLITTGTIMWWRRRPVGSLGVPVITMPVSPTPAIINTAVALALLLPLFGLSLLLILLMERLYALLRSRTT